MSQPRDDRQDDPFRSSLEQIINLRHPLVRLAAEINWDFLAKRFSSVCRLGPGQPPLPTRLVAGLAAAPKLTGFNSGRLSVVVLGIASSVQS